MKIVITESLFKKLIINLVNENAELTEIMGIPSNIYETSQNIWNQFLKQLPLPDSQYNPSKNGYETMINGPFVIGDIRANNAKISVLFDSKYDSPQFELLSLGCVGQASLTSDFKMETIPDKTIQIRITFSSNENLDKNKVFDTIIEDSKRISVSMAHEMMHYYKNIKRKALSAISQSEYDTYNEMPGLVPLNQYMRNMYYTHKIENTVRPTEFYASMKLSNVDQKGFYEFLTKHPIYNELKNISNWSVDKMKSDLHNYIPEITQALTNLNAPEANDNDDEKVNAMLKYFYAGMSNKTGENLERILFSNPFEAIFGISEEKIKFFEDYMNSLKKNIDTPLKFFAKSEELMKNASRKVIRKLAKQYALAKNEENPDTKLPLK